MPEGDQGGLNPGLPGGWCNWKVSGFPTVLVPAYSLLKQEQLQLAQASFRNFAGRNTTCQDISIERS